MKQQNYHEVDQLANLYLEDSFILDIVESSESISFVMEIVLTESHPLFSSPKDGEVYCYRRGHITFMHPRSVKWTGRSMKPLYTDADGKRDYGNIDSFVIVDGVSYMEGDWGSLELRCDELSVELDLNQ